MEFNFKILKIWMDKIPKSQISRVTPKDESNSSIQDDIVIRF